MSMYLPFFGFKSTNTIKVNIYLINKKELTVSETETADQRPQNKV